MKKNYFNLNFNYAEELKNVRMHTAVIEGATSCIGGCGVLVVPDGPGTAALLVPDGPGTAACGALLMSEGSVASV